MDTSTTDWIPGSRTYEELALELDAMLGGERDWIANTANAAAFVYHALVDVNWVGFYFLRGQELVLGPFQGRPACIRIPLGKGVCGTAAIERRPVLVPDVHRFEGHIACDPRSRSELVLPLIHEDHLLGVFDLDSPKPARFQQVDVTGLSALVEILLAKSDRPPHPQARAAADSARAEGAASGS